MGKPYNDYCLKLLAISQKSVTECKKLGFDGQASIEALPDFIDCCQKLLKVIDSECDHPLTYPLKTVTEITRSVLNKAKGKKEGL